MLRHYVWDAFTRRVVPGRIHGRHLASCGCVLAFMHAGWDASAAPPKSIPTPRAVEVAVEDGGALPKALGDEDDANAIRQQLEALADDRQIAGFTAARHKLSQDRYRPLYHFVAPNGFMNDPNGMCQWNGKYHLFYQSRPWGDKAFHWGHAYSDDMVHWKDLPLAIVPSEPGVQAYSGQTLVEEDRVLAAYHRTTQGNFIAESSDPLLVHWNDLPDNTSIRLGQKDHEGRGIRIFDPDIWGEDDGYYTISGVFEHGTRGLDGTGQMVQHLFHSSDLSDWEYMGRLVEGRDWTDPGEDGAVPRFLPIGKGKHILIFFSHARAAQYMIGEYDRTKRRFTPESHGRFNFGPWLMGSLHAPGAFIDDQGRLIVIFNMRENMVSEADPTRGIAAREWAGVMTLPRQLWLDENNQLRSRPIPELEVLREEPVHLDETVIPAHETVLLPAVRGKALEIDAHFAPGNARELGLEVLRSPDGQEKTVITFYRDAGQAEWRQIGIDVSGASLRPDVKSRSPEIAMFQLDQDEPIRLRVFVDQSIVEVFVNDVKAIALRVYPLREDSDGVALFSKGGSTTLQSLDAWRMRSIWGGLDQ